MPPRTVSATQGIRATALGHVRRVPLARIRQGAATRRAQSVVPGNTRQGVGRRARARARRARQTRTRRRGVMRPRTVSAMQGLRVMRMVDVSFVLQCLPVLVAILVQMAPALYARPERLRRAKAAPLAAVARQILILTLAVSVRQTALVMQASRR